MNENYDLYGLAYECPKFKRKENCPFKVMDGLPFKEKLRLMNDFSDEKNTSILEHHHRCSRNSKPE